MSTHTIRSYRDALVLFLRFLSRVLRRGIEKLEITDLTAIRVEAFLMSLERERHNSITTRNTQLAALHTFARYRTCARKRSRRDLRSAKQSSWGFNSPLCWAN